MKKIGKGILGYIILAIVFMVLSVIAFAAPFHKTSGAFWMGYLFGVLAIAFQVYVFKVAFTGEEDAKSKFYGLPIIKVGVIYLALQFVVSIIEMALATFIPFWLPLIVNVIFLVVAAVGTIATKVMKEEIIRQDIVVERDTTNMRKLQNYSVELIELCKDAESKQIVSKIAEEFRYSDPVSNENTLELENELLEELTAYKDVIIEGKLEEVRKMGDKIIRDLTGRNMVCSLNKK